MLFERLVALFSFEIFLVVDVVIGVLWIPLGVSELLFFLEIFLWSPEFS